MSVCGSDLDLSFFFFSVFFFFFLNYEKQWQHSNIWTTSGTVDDFTYFSFFSSGKPAELDMSLPARNDWPERPVHLWICSHFWQLSPPVHWWRWVSSLLVLLMLLDFHLLWLLVWNRILSDSSEPSCRVRLWLDTEVGWRKMFVVEQWNVSCKTNLKIMPQWS